MSRHGDITFLWADGEKTFRLAIGQLRELQEKCDAGPMEVLRRLVSGRWRVDDVRQTIRLGLIGGGEVKPVDAELLVRSYVDERPWLENVSVAVRILNAALTGPEDEKLPKAEGEEPIAEEPPQKKTTKRKGSSSVSTTDGVRH